jgi:hypothetical protein
LEQLMVLASSVADVDVDVDADVGSVSKKQG